MLAMRRPPVSAVQIRIVVHVRKDSVLVLDAPSLMFRTLVRAHLAIALAMNPSALVSRDVVFVAIVQKPRQNLLLKQARQPATVGGKKASVHAQKDIVPATAARSNLFMELSDTCISFCHEVFGRVTFLHDIMNRQKLTQSSRSSQLPLPHMTLQLLGLELLILQKLPLSSRRKAPMHDCCYSCSTYKRTYEGISGTTTSIKQ